MEEKIILMEISAQKKLLKDSQTVLSQAPKGSLFIRERASYHYQLHGVHIRKNLIITQDDSKGSCNSAFICKIIEEYILPYFK